MKLQIGTVIRWDTVCRRRKGNAVRYNSRPKSELYLPDNGFKSSRPPRPLKVQAVQTRTRGCPVKGGCPHPRVDAMLLALPCRRRPWSRVQWRSRPSTSAADLPNVPDRTARAIDRAVLLLSPRLIAPWHARERVTLSQRPSQPRIRRPDKHVVTAFLACPYLRHPSPSRRLQTVSNQTPGRHSRTVGSPASRKLTPCSCTWQPR